MPVQIQEMIIRATVGEPAEKKASPSPPSTSEPMKEEIVKECVEKILEIINREKERWWAKPI